MQAIQHPGNEAVIDSLLDDLSRTEDSTEAARKAKQLRQLVSGVPITSEEVEKAAYRIAGTPEHERLKAEIASISRSVKLEPVWYLCSVVLTIAAAAWLGLSRTNQIGPDILLGLGIVLNAINLGRLYSNSRLARFARDTKRINDQADKQ